VSVLYKAKGHCCFDKDPCYHCVNLLYLYKL